MGYIVSKSLNLGHLLKTKKSPIKPWRLFRRHYEKRNIALTPIAPRPLSWWRQPVAMARDAGSSQSALQPCVCSSSSFSSQRTRSPVISCGVAGNAKRRPKIWKDKSRELDRNTVQLFPKGRRPGAKTRFYFIYFPEFPRRGKDPDGRLFESSGACVWL